MEHGQTDTNCIVTIIAKLCIYPNIGENAKSSCHVESLMGRKHESASKKVEHRQSNRLWTKVVIGRMEQVHQLRDNRVEIRWTGDSSARYKGSQFTAICADHVSSNYVA